jgi:MSHA biogenesis protein MshO
MTLIELVVVITLTSIVICFADLFIVTPIEAFNAERQRAQLTDAADGALRLLSRDLRAALPNSVRVNTNGTVTALEFIATVDGARYQDNGPSTTEPNANDALWLDFTQSDTAFSTTVPFTQIGLPFTSSSDYLVIYNVGVTGANAYDSANVITPAGTAITVKATSAANVQLVTLVFPNATPTFQFKWPSPGKRVYLVSGPVSYLCDTSTGVLTRYSGYLMLSSQPTSVSMLTAAGASAGTVANSLSACNFVYSPGTYTRSGLATLSLTMAANSQQVQLVHQVHLVNAP